MKKLKIARLMHERWGREPNYRWSTLKAAGRKNRQTWLRFSNAWMSRTKGWRWGRWDPARPIPPGEIPF